MKFIKSWVFLSIVFISSSSCSSGFVEVKYFGVFANEPTYKYDFKPDFKNEIEKENLTNRVFYYKASYDKGVLVNAIKFHKDSGEIVSIKFDPKGRIIENIQKLDKLKKEVCTYVYKDEIAEKISECSIGKSQKYKYHSFYKNNRTYRVNSLNDQNQIKSYAKFDYLLKKISKFDSRGKLIKQVDIKQ